jgi:hypothetical protein
MVLGLKRWTSLVFLGAMGCSVSVPPGGDSDGDERTDAEQGALVEGELVGFAAGDAKPIAAAVTWYMVQNRAEFGDYFSHIVASAVTRLEPDVGHFRLELSDPPPPQAFVEYGHDDGVNPFYTAPYEAAFGTVAVLGVEQAGPRNEIAPADVRGVALDIGIVYFNRDGLVGDPNDDVNEEAASLGVPPTRGYHLHTVEMSREARAQNQQCMWNGLCVESIGDEDAVEAELAQDMYAQCVEVAPDAERCRWVQGDVLTEEEAVENARCRALMDQYRSNPNCKLPFEFPSYPLESPAAVTVDANAKLWQWYFGL